MATALQPPAIESTGDRKKVTMGLVTVFVTYAVYYYYLQSLLSAVPKIAADLNAMDFYSWGIAIPNLGLAFGTLLVGKLSDLYGRRALLLSCLAICLAGSVLCALSPTFVILIAARTLLCIGQGGLAPLCFAVLGDMLDPVSRSKWIGLLNIPAGLVAFVAPTLGGWFVDNPGWRFIFWSGIPLVAIALVMTLFGLSAKEGRAEQKIDSRGALLAAVASSAMILAFSMAGTLYPWSSLQVLGLLAASIIFWVLFVKAEARAEEPILDLQLFQSRTFVTIVSACLLSCFGMTGLMFYYPLLLQGVQGASATLTGQIMTLGNVLMSFIGVPAGFILARTLRYRWMYLVSYGLTAAVMISLVFFTAATPKLLGFLAFTLAGMGMGALPTVNTLVAQCAVPRRLLGVATGALFFSVMIGQAIAPAIIGSALSMRYNSVLQANLPAQLAGLVGQDTMESLGDPSVLLSKPAMQALRTTLEGGTAGNKEILDQTVAAIRLAMESGLKVIFLLGAVTMLLALLIICTIPQIAIGAEVTDAPAKET